MRSSRQQPNPTKRAKHTQSAGKAKPRNSKPRRTGTHRLNGLPEVLVGAFLLGIIYGAFHTEHPWRGRGMFWNVGSVLGTAAFAVLIMAVVWALTRIRTWVAALIRSFRQT
jgi:hypothetical protein